MGDKVNIMEQENKSDNVFKKIIKKLSPPAKVMAVFWTLCSLFMVTSEIHTFTQKVVVILFGYIFYCGIANLIYKIIPRNRIGKSNENSFDKAQKGNVLETNNYNTLYSKTFECDELMAPQYLKILQDSVNIFNNTKNPDTFFERYALAEEQAEKLCCLRNIKYTGQSPIDIKRQLIDKKQSAIYNMIDRYFDATEIKASKLKSVSKKIECFSMFITVLEEYYYFMNEENIQYAETLYNNAMSYITDGQTEPFINQDIDNEKENQFDSVSLYIKDITFDNLRKYNMDLVVFHGQKGGCCSECSKMIGRVYSVSGKNNTFPKLPEYVKINGNFHKGCRCTMSPYFGEENIFHHGEYVNAIESSLRPYRDDRTEHEINAYKEYINRIEEYQKKENDRKEYEEILIILPDFAPKSFGAYRKMKNSNSKNFEKLKKLAFEKGFEIK